MQHNLSNPHLALWLTMLRLVNIYIDYTSVSFGLNFATTVYLEFVIGALSESPICSAVDVCYKLLDRQGTTSSNSFFSVI